MRAMILPAMPTIPLCHAYLAGSKKYFSITHITLLLSVFSLAPSASLAFAPSLGLNTLQPRQGS